MPVFSVVLPTHNRAELLQRAVNSVLSQQFSDFELIIVDDGSRDGTAAYLTRAPIPGFKSSAMKTHKGLLLHAMPVFARHPELG